jgi:hypothetical protein
MATKRWGIEGRIHTLAALRQFLFVSLQRQPDPVLRFRSAVSITAFNSLFEWAQWFSNSQGDWLPVSP